MVSKILGLFTKLGLSPIECPPYKKMTFIVAPGYTRVSNESYYKYVYHC